MTLPKFNDCVINSFCCLTLTKKKKQFNLGHLIFHVLARKYWAKKGRMVLMYGFYITSYIFLTVTCLSNKRINKKNSVTGRKFLNKNSLS